MSSLARSTFCALYKYSGVMHVQERIAYWAGQRPMIVLLFHRVTDEIPLDGLTVSTAWFRGFCELMRDRFHVVPLQEVHRMLQEGVQPPLRTVAITFDDSYRDNLFAARVLTEHRLPATFFVPTKYIGTDHVFEWDVGLPRMANLTWDDINEMQSLGHEICSHSVSHPDFGVIDAEKARMEMMDSKKELEDRLQRRCHYFAYPYGARTNFKPEYNVLIKEAGYDACFSAFGGFVESHMRGHILPRQAMPYFRSLLHLEVYLTGCMDWLYDVKRVASVLTA